MLAPICVFAFNRPLHLQATLDALARNPEAVSSVLHVFCDAARGPQDEAATREVRHIARAERRFREVRVHEREGNRGLAGSIISGVTEVVAQAGKVIVLEDDMLTSPHFLKFMNEGLDFYQNDARVASVHAYLGPFPRPLGRNFFRRGGDCWGWATWERAWAFFEPDGQRLLQTLRERSLEKAFDLNHSMAYVQMLTDQIAGRNNSWAIRWHASLFVRGLLTLYPARSLVKNIGFDGSGTHCVESDSYEVELSATPVPVTAIPVKEDPEAVRQFELFYRRENPRWRRWIPKFAKDWLPSSTKRKIKAWLKRAQAS